MNDGVGRPASGFAGSASWELNPFFMIDVEFTEVDGRTVVRRLEVYPLDPRTLPANGLTARDVREIHFDEMLTGLDRDIAGSAPSPLPSVIGEELGVGRGRRRSADFYASIADLYLEALRVAPRRPVVHVADVLVEEGYPVKVNQVRSWINLARRYGFLTEGLSGSAGASPTEELLAWRKGSTK